MTDLPTVIDCDETETREADSWNENSPLLEWELRVMMVSALWVLPGLLFGLLVRLCVSEGGPAEVWLVGGGILGAIAGGFLEADHWFS